VFSVGSSRPGRPKSGDFSRDFTDLIRPLRLCGLDGKEPTVMPTHATCFGAFGPFDGDFDPFEDDESVGVLIPLE
jgi:hypothetical protein